MRRVTLVTTQDGVKNDGNRNLERVMKLLAARLSLQNSGRRLRVIMQGRREAKAFGRTDACYGSCYNSGRSRDSLVIESSSG